MMEMSLSLGISLKAKSPLNLDINQLSFSHESNTKSIEISSTSRSVNQKKETKLVNPHNKMPSLIAIGVLVENDVKFHDNSMDIFHQNTIKMNQNLQSHWMTLEFHDVLEAFYGDAFFS